MSLRENSGKGTEYLLPTNKTINSDQGLKPVVERNKLAVTGLFPSSRESAKQKEGKESRRFTPKETVGIIQNHVGRYVDQFLLMQGIRKTEGVNGNNTVDNSVVQSYFRSILINKAPEERDAAVWLSWANVKNKQQVPLETLAMLSKAKEAQDEYGVKQTIALDVNITNLEYHLTQNDQDFSQIEEKDRALLLNIISANYTHDPIDPQVLSLLTAKYPKNPLVFFQCSLQQENTPETLSSLLNFSLQEHAQNSTSFHLQRIDRLINDLKFIEIYHADKQIGERICSCTVYGSADSVLDQPYTNRVTSPLVSDVTFSKLNQIKDWIDVVNESESGTYNESIRALLDLLKQVSEEVVNNSIMPEGYPETYIKEQIKGEKILAYVLYQSEYLEDSGNTMADVSSEIERNSTRVSYAWGQFQSTFSKTESRVVQAMYNAERSASGNAETVKDYNKILAAAARYSRLSQIIMNSEDFGSDDFALGGEANRSLEQEFGKYSLRELSDIKIQSLMLDLSLDARIRGILALQSRERFVQLSSQASHLISDELTQGQKANKFAREMSLALLISNPQKLDLKLRGSMSTDEELLQGISSLLASAATSAVLADKLVENVHRMHPDSIRAAKEYVEKNIKSEVVEDTNAKNTDPKRNKEKSTYPTDEKNWVQKGKDQLMKIRGQIEKNRTDFITKLPELVGLFEAIAVSPNPDKASKDYQEKLQEFALDMVVQGKINTLHRLAAFMSEIGDKTMYAELINGPLKPILNPSGKTAFATLNQVVAKHTSRMEKITNSKRKPFQSEEQLNQWKIQKKEKASQKLNTKVNKLIGILNTRIDQLSNDRTGSKKSSIVNGYPKNLFLSELEIATITVGAGGETFSKTMIVRRQLETSMLKIIQDKMLKSTKLKSEKQSQSMSTKGEGKWQLWASEFIGSYEPVLPLVPPVLNRALSPLLKLVLKSPLFQVERASTYIDFYDRYLKANAIVDGYPNALAEFKRRIYAGEFKWEDFIPSFKTKPKSEDVISLIKQNDAQKIERVKILNGFSPDQILFPALEVKDKGQIVSTVENSELNNLENRHVTQQELDQLSNSDLIRQMPLDTLFRLCGADFMETFIENYVKQPEGAVNMESSGGTATEKNRTRATFSLLHDQFSAWAALFKGKEISGYIEDDIIGELKLIGDEHIKYAQLKRAELQKAKELKESREGFRPYANIGLFWLAPPLNLLVNGLESASRALNPKTKEKGTLFQKGIKLIVFKLSWRGLIYGIPILGFSGYYDPPKDPTAYVLDIMPHDNQRRHLNKGGLNLVNFSDNPVLDTFLTGSGQFQHLIGNITTNSSSTDTGPQQVIAPTIIPSNQQGIHEDTPTTGIGGKSLTPLLTATPAAATNPSGAVQVVPTKVRSNVTPPTIKP